jgi:hypothetical protein
MRRCTVARAAWSSDASMPASMHSLSARTASTDDINRSSDPGNCKSLRCDRHSVAAALQYRDVAHITSCGYACRHCQALGIGNSSPVDRRRIKRCMDSAVQGVVQAVSCGVARAQTRCAPPVFQNLAIGIANSKRHKPCERCPTIHHVI